MFRSAAPGHHTAQSLPNLDYREAEFNKLSVDLERKKKGMNNQRLLSKLRMFDDRLEIESPGRLPATVKPENIARERFARNPTIFRVLMDLGYVRDLGEGIDRMRDEMKRADLPEPLFSEPGYSFEVVLENTAIYGEKTDEWLKQLKGVELSEQQRRALAFIFKYGEINNTQYRKINRVNRDRAVRDLHALVSLKLIKQFGKKRGARYVLTEESYSKRA